MFSNESAPAHPFIALLLNTTRDEGEEFLDYGFPMGDPKFQEVAPMKGVFLASCGIMESTVGQEISSLSFRSADGCSEYKALLRRIEVWVLCCVFPGATPDRLAGFFIEEVVALISVRHGRLASLQSRFEGLDPAFEAVGRLWKRIANSEMGEGTDLFYASFGMTRWTPPLPSESRGVVEAQMERWVVDMQSLASRTQLAHCGYALFCNRGLVQTSLQDTDFRTCLRLCHLEGLWNDLLPVRGHSASSFAYAEEDAQVVCHSIILKEESDATVPTSGDRHSHQYVLLRQGPWLLFMLWRLGPATNSGNDPFCVRPCQVLLKALCSLVNSADLPTMDTKPVAKKPARRNSFSFKPFSRSSKTETRSSSSEIVPQRRSSGFFGKRGSMKTSGDLGGPSTQSIPSLRALELAVSTPSAKDSRAAWSIRYPHWTALDRASPILLASTPEILKEGPEIVARESADWGPCNSEHPILEWVVCEDLFQEIAQRRSRWIQARDQGHGSNQLLKLLRGKVSLEKLWEDSLEEEDGKPGRSEAQAMTQGESWRFQRGSPFFLRDFPPVSCVGALLGSGTNHSWVVASNMQPPRLEQTSGMPPTFVPRRGFLYFAGAEAVPIEAPRAGGGTANRAQPGNRARSGTEPLQTIGRPPMPR